MSSMTLKQFMTRGMEKDAADYIYDPETRGISYDPKATVYGTNSLLTSPIAQYFFNKGIDENKESVVNGLNKWIPGSGDIVARMAIPPDTYRTDNGEAMMQQAQSLVEYLKPIVADDAKYAEEIKKIEGAYGKEQAAKVKEVLDGVRNIPGLRTLYNMSPNMFNAIADKHIYRYIMKQFGMDPSKVGDYVKDLNSYDMNQYIPGMAAAFGIPLGIGALTGHPGWGLLLGMLGAGAYGYAKYNHIFDKPADVKPVETPAPEAPATTPESPKDLGAPVSEDPPEAIPAPDESPATEAAPTPAAEAPSGLNAPVSKDISSGGEGSSAPTPIASNEDIGTQEQERLGLDTLDSEIEPSSAPVVESPALAPTSAPVAQPSAPVVEKKNSTTPSYPARQPIKIDTSKPVPEWVNPEEKIPAPSVQNVNIPLIPPVTPAPIGFDYLEQLQPKPMGKPSVGLPSVEEWRKEHPTRTTENVVRVKPRRTPSSGPKKDIVIEVPPHQETKEQTGPGFVPRNGLAVPPFFF